MKVKMNENVLNTIHAVRDYRKFLLSYHVILLGNEQYDKDAEAEKFFYNLPIKELPKCKACYEALICYPQMMLEALDDMKAKDLHNCEFRF